MLLSAVSFGDVKHTGGSPASEGGIERVFTSVGNHHDALDEEHIEGRTLESTPNYRLVMTKESSPMMMIHTGNTSSGYGGQEVGRRKGAEQVVVVWT